MRQQYTVIMRERDHLDEYLAICRRIYERMVIEGTWPWLADSPNPEDMLDSDSNQNPS